MPTADGPADPPGYRPLMKVLHWTMFAALSVQFVVGYSIDRADDLLAWVVDTWLGGESDRLVIVHAAIGLMILSLAIVRYVWRGMVGLPPWAEQLSAGERRLAHRVEQVLYATMFVIPITGLALLFLSGEDWDLANGRWEAPVELIDDDLALGAHVTTHVAFFAAVLLHVGLVLKHQLIQRDHLLRRMW